MSREMENRIAELEQQVDGLVHAVADHVTVRAEQYARIADLEQQLTESNDAAEYHIRCRGDALRERDHLKAQNLALLVAMGLMKIGIELALKSEGRDVAIHLHQALARQPNADLLAERDKRRDAALICSIGFPTMLRKMWAGSEVLRFLNDKAAARLDGSWAPELGDTP